MDVAPRQLISKSTIKVNNLYSQSILVSFPIRTGVCKSVSWLELLSASERIKFKNIVPFKNPLYFNSVYCRNWFTTWCTSLHVWCKVADTISSTMISQQHIVMQWFTFCCYLFLLHSVVMCVLLFVFS